MSGTVIGGYKAAKTNKELYGKDFYVIQGRKGGKKSRGGGWTGRPDLARLAGAKGGKASWKKLDGISASPKQHKTQGYTGRLYRAPDGTLIVGEEA